MTKDKKNNKGKERDRNREKIVTVKGIESIIKV
jgi:hypothetical protein